MKNNKRTPITETDFGKNVRKLIQEKGISLNMLADRSGVNRGNLSKMVNGKIGYSMDTLAQLAEALGVSSSDLIASETPVLRLPHGLRVVPLMSTVHLLQFAQGKEDIPKSDSSLVIDSSHSERAYGFEVHDEGVLPDILLGSTVVVDPGVEPKRGNYVIATDGNHDVFVRVFAPLHHRGAGVGDFVLVPANSLFPRIDSREHELKILGVVVELRSPNPQAPVK